MKLFSLVTCHIVAEDMKKGDGQFQIVESIKETQSVLFLNYKINAT